MTHEKMVFTFLGLPIPTRMRIARELKLISKMEVETALKPVWDRLFDRAAENGQITELIGELETILEKD